MIAKKCSENEIRMLFAPFGAIEECTILRENEQSKGEYRYMNRVIQYNTYNYDLYSEISNLKLLCCALKITTEKVCFLVPFWPRLRGAYAITWRPSATSNMAARQPSWKTNKVLSLLN
jgi:hypothetical protein